jgi:photosystem II stability/assembly factor-like uncharacterized protein
MLNSKKILVLSSAFLTMLAGYTIIQIFVFGKRFHVEKENLEQPYDEFWVKRSFPGLKPDENAYFSGLEQARLSLSNRGNIPGFDKNWQVEGPANIGARVNVLAVNPNNENIILAGYSHGGIWKTNDGGINWYPVFDDQVALAIGAIEFDPQNPSVVYAGTGDVNIPGGVYTGNGIYKSIDGGETWSYLALSETRIISKIWVSPKNSSIIYASAMGNPFEKNVNRGFYKSTDSGKTWTQLLFVNNQTGVIDFVVNPDNPNFIFAASYTRVRTNYESIVTSKDCIVWRSTNGGINWTPLQSGLPLGEEHSRIGLAMCPSDPTNVFALFVGTSLDLENIYKTQDNGDTWELVPTYDTGLPEGQMGSFGWYFGKLGIDPNDCNTLHVLGVDMYSTFDGGASWVPTVPPWWTYEVHADKHDIVYTKSGNILLGTDGGIYKTNDFNTWTKIENIPTSQFYRVAYNPHQPDYYYGGMQDNGTSGGNASFLNDWPRLFGGDGFQPRFNPNDPNNYYYETQNAGIVGTETDGADFYDLITEENGVDPDERRNWDAQYIISNFNSDVLYYGGQKVYKSEDRGHNWIPISGELTGDIKFLSRVHVITSVDESIIDEKILYAGTGNGYLWKTNDGGITWDSIHQNGLPVRYLTSVHSSPTFKNTVFVTFSGYKFNELIPHVYRSDDQGQSWIEISSNLPGVGVNDILIIPGEKDEELYVATDGGVYGSIDGGQNWERVGVNMPLVPVLDIDYNPSLKTLIAGTFARSIMSYPIEGISSNSEILPNGPEISVYPNPAVNILFWNTNSTKASESDIKVYDLKGNIVLQKANMKGQDNINVEALLPGVYLLSLEINGAKKYKKFVKN